MIEDQLVKSLIRDAFLADISFNIDKARQRVRAGVILLVAGAILFVASALIMRLMAPLYPLFLVLPALALTVLLVGIALLVFDFIRVRYALAMKKERAEGELPFLAVYMSMVSAFGLSFRAAMEEIKNLSIFKHFRKEFNYIKKIMTFYAYSPIDALEFVSRIHPSSKVREFYKSLVVSERSGGVTFSYLIDKTKEYMALLEDRVMRQIESFSTLTNIEMLLFVVLPVGVISVAILFAGNFGLPIVAMSLAMFPLISFAVMNSVIEAIIAKELVETPPMKLAAVSLVALLALSLGISVAYAVTGRVFSEEIPPYELAGVMAAAVVVSLAPAAVYYERWRRESAAFIYSLPTMSKMITEEVRKGKTPRQSILRLIEHKFSPRVTSFVRGVTAKILSGFTIKDALTGIKMPWLARMYFELIDVADRLGADPRPLDLLNTFISTVASVKKILEDRALSFKVSALVAIGALAFGIHIVTNVVSKQLTQIGQALESIKNTVAAMPVPLQIPVQPIPQEQIGSLVQIGYAAVVVNAVIMGLLTGKLLQGSVAFGLKDAIIFTIVAILIIILFNFAGIFVTH